MRVSLEPVEVRHLTFLKDLRNLPEVQDFCRQPYQLNSQNQDDWFKMVCKSREFIPFIVTDEELPREKQWVGYCALSHVDPIADKAECSYVIHPQYRGVGYGKEAIFQLLYFGFYHLGLQKIYSDTFDYNKEEIAINEACGFKQNGYLPRHYFKRGKLIGAVPMSILREDFESTWEDKLKTILYAPSKPL